MKNLISYILSMLNFAYIILKKETIDAFTGRFYLTSINKEKGNKIKLEQTITAKTQITIIGANNELTSNNSLIEDSSILINGTNNQLIISENVKLRKANIIIRGSNCLVKIGKATTFGGVRIVNVGNNNNVTIGENCLFSDHIEIWASDTHSIYNENDEKINSEKPIIIGDSVWIGSHVIILKGIKINDGAIIGMGTIVSKNVPMNSISVGSPNRVIKQNVRWTNEY